MHHMSDNLFFGRLPDGSVRILKFPDVEWRGNDGRSWPKVDGVYADATLDIVVKDGLWCSAVSSVSHGGEENGRWYDAMKFHNGKTPSVLKVP